MLLADSPVLTVRRIILEGDRATGVKTVPTKPLTTNQDRPKVYKARKFIIVSGGTLSSPLILQRSGIGENMLLRSSLLSRPATDTLQATQRSSARRVSSL